MKSIALLLNLLITLSAQCEYIVPLNIKQWKILSYRKIPSHEVSNDSKGSLVVKVNSSASPLILPLPKMPIIKSIHVSGTILGKIELKDLIQGQKGADDFTFRIGLVLEGNKKLNFLQRSIAPAWIKKLYSLGKNSKGISSIYFYNVVEQRQLEGQKREHPLSDLLIENYSLYRLPEQFKFELNIERPPSQKVLALWISIDGDDTNSQFTTTINQIRIKD